MISNNSEQKETIEEKPIGHDRLVENEIQEAKVDDTQQNLIQEKIKFKFDCDLLQYYIYKNNTIRSLSEVEVEQFENYPFKKVQIKRCEKFSSFKNENIEMLKNVELLELQHCAFTSLNDETFDVLQLEKLSELNLTDNLLKEIKDTFTQNCASLKTLVLSDNDLKSIQELQYLTNLEELLLSHNQLSSLNGLQTLSKLKVLDVSHNLLIDLKGVEQCVQLQELQASYNQIIDISALQPLNVRFLFLQHNDIEFIQTLKNMNLEKVTLTDNNVQSDNELQCFANMANLKDVLIYDNPVCHTVHFLTKFSFYLNKSLNNSKLRDVSFLNQDNAIETVRKFDIDGLTPKQVEQLPFIKKQFSEKEIQKEIFTMFPYNWAYFEVANQLVFTSDVEGHRELMYQFTIKHKDYFYSISKTYEDFCQLQKQLSVQTKETLKVNWVHKKPNPLTTGGNKEQADSYCQQITKIVQVLINHTKIRQLEVVKQFLSSTRQQMRSIKNKQCYNDEL